MCYLCKNNDLGDGFGGDFESCQNCGRLICFDVDSGDDVIRPAYVTSSGDLFCDPCGRKHDEPEEAELDSECERTFDELQE